MTGEERMESRMRKADLGPRVIVVQEEEEFPVPVKIVNSLGQVTNVYRLVKTQYGKYLLQK
jgi:hypothetical protein